MKEIQICPAHLVIFKLKMVAYFKCFCVNFFNHQISERFMKIIKIHARTFFIFIAFISFLLVKLFVSGTAGQIGLPVISNLPPFLPCPLLFG